VLTAAVPVAVAVVILLSGSRAIGWLLGTGDAIPAVLYLSTLILGVAQLLDFVTCQKVVIAVHEAGVAAAPRRVATSRPDGN
jgi:hypothetical protein